MYELFLFTFDLKYPNKLQFKNAYFTEILTLLIFEIGVAVGVVVVHAGLSAVSDCAPMVRKVKVTNGMQELRTEEDSLELRQVGSW